MGGDAGAHAYRDALGAIDQEVGHTDRQHLRLFLCLIIVGDKIHGLVQVL